MSRPAMRWIRNSWPIGVIACAFAQDRDAGQVRSSVAAAAVTVQASFDCSVEISGEPVFREFSRKWEVAFFASGADCDDLYRELQRQIVPLDVLLYRRPNLAQGHNIIAGIFASVRPFGCAVALRGEPSFDEASGQWFARYGATGEGCDQAADFLRDVGAERQILFLRIVSRQDLLR